MMHLTSVKGYSILMGATQRMILMIILQLVCYFGRTQIGSKRLIAAFLILHVAALRPTAAQELDVDSIPEPTKLSLVAAAESAEITVVKSPIPLHSENSIAEVSIIEVVTSKAKHHRGIRVLLKNATQHDDIYFDENQASQLRDEFAGMKMWYENNQTCEVNSQCHHGVARCRPSQVVRQAFCPGFYTSWGGEQGAVVSTQHHSFYFPSITPSMFADVIDSALSVLTQQESK